LKQLGHQLLSQPNCFILKPNLDARAPVLGLVDQDFRSGRLVRQIGHGRLSPIPVYGEKDSVHRAGSLMTGCFDILGHIANDGIIPRIKHFGF
jgi:hypothetical protein